MKNKLYCLTLALFSCICFELVWAEVLTIEEKDFKYFHQGNDVTGQTIKARQGDSLKFTNVDTTAHIVYTNINQKTKISGLQKPKVTGGEDYVVQLDEICLYKISCPIHEVMILNVETTSAIKS